LVGVFVQDHDDGCGDEIIFCLFLLPIDNRSLPIDSEKKGRDMRE